MTTMKRITARVLPLALLLVLLVLTAALSSCGGKDEKDEDLLGLFVEYVGPEITTTEHEFTPDEFCVIAAYPNNIDKELDSKDFSVELDSLNGGRFTVKITYRGHEQYAYVECHVPVYPSELGTNP